MLSINDYNEPIPGVFIPPDKDIPTKLKALFPQSHFSKLWELYPIWFDELPESKEED